jgi:hypothetical protein
MFEIFVQEEQTRNRERADAIRLKHLPTHVQQLAAQNFCVLYTTIAFRIKKLASENMVTYAFHDANRALENLQQETAGAREIMKFEKAQRIIARAGELLQHTIELAEEIQITTYVQHTERREDPKQQQDRGHLKLPLKQFPVQTEKQRQNLMRQLKTVKKEMRQIQNQFETKKDNKRKRQVTEHPHDKTTSAQEEEEE